MIIDITNEMLTDIKNALTDAHVSTSQSPTTPKFPTVIVEELVNSDDLYTKDSSGFTHSNISYAIEIYTIGTTRMSQAKKIRNQINEIISNKYGIARTSSSPIPNYLDENVYRYRMSYSGKIGKNKTIYRG